MIGVLAAAYVWGRYFGGSAGELQRMVDRSANDLVVAARSGWAGDAADDLRDLVGIWTLILLRWSVVIAMIVFKRWRHLAVFVGSVVLVTIVTAWFPTAGAIGHEPGVVGHASLAEAGVVVTMLGVVYGLAPHGTWRDAAKVATAASAIVVGAVLILTDQNTLAEVAVGAVGAAAICVLGYRLFAPEQVFPVRYERGRTAHLELTDQRTGAIQRGLRDQLGLEAVEIAPFGLEGSGGSTPLKISLDDGSLAFGKLYATNHLRADRWYKLGRTILYGALEDERSFNSVRRMVEYEDHMLRYLRDHDVPTAEPIGVVELTPEREYLLVTGFVEDAHELTDGAVNEATIASGVRLVRSLWDAGVAHRDLKPSNLLVRDDEIVLIDDFFCQIRPSPWRQSVDLANMLLTLALRSDAETVYTAARARFTDEELAEAFAATRGVTIPSQLRRMLRDDGRDLCGTFRSLAPPRRRIAIQRWTLRRILLLLSLAAGMWIALTTAYQNLHPAGFGT